MREIEIEGTIAERLDRFRPVFADVSETKPNEATLELAANVVLIRGLDLTMVEFFRKLDDDTLSRSLQLFHKKHPRCVEPAPLDSSLSDNELVNEHVALSRRYPREFFAFMFETLKSEEWAEARERFHRLFRGK
jgi:hypothetical protein